MSESNVVNLADYRKPRFKLDIEVKLDSKKACELIDAQTLLALCMIKAPTVTIDGQTIELDMDDIFNELETRD